MRYSMSILTVLLLNSCGGSQVVVRETQASCGDGIVQTGEQCDDKNEDTNDACTNFCTVALCGDGVMRNDLSDAEPGYEGCDDSNADDDDACTSQCQIAVCGDGVLRADLSEGDEGFEYCDDGNSDEFDACRVNCQVARCGDGVVRADLEIDQRGYEACDDGNDDPTDDCNNCEPASCGDEIVQQGERCDDGNEEDDDERKKRKTREHPEAQLRICEKYTLDNKNGCADMNRDVTEGFMSLLKSQIDETLKSE